MTHGALMTNTPEFFSDISEEIRLFLSADKIELLTLEDSVPQKDICVWHRIVEDTDGGISEAKLFIEGKQKGANQYAYSIEGTHPIEVKRAKKAAVKISVYRLLSCYTKKKMPWGPLTGIRPTKYLRDLSARIGQAEAEDYLLKTLSVSKPKFKLAKSIVMAQHKIISDITDNSVDIYIGIPFCPTICAYCSFGSKRLKRGDTIQAQYMDALLTEIEALKANIQKRDIRSVYIGGGTPTSLDLPVLECLLASVSAWGEGREFTVEAGRPDTINADMLVLLKKYGVNRISINPQTFKPQTLTAIGRQHTVERFYQAFYLAREHGFGRINIDLILGLPGETLKDMKTSVQKAIDLNPENITVHTLAIKNAAAFGREIKYSADEAKIQTAVTMAERLCSKNGYAPYYMYRQKYMKGNLENVGYAKDDSMCIYNIDMMEEVTDVMAFGAGAISKKVYRSQGRHERIPNPKDIATYLEKTKTIIEKKKSAF